MTMSLNEEKTSTRRKVKEASVTPLTGRPRQHEKPPANWPGFGEYARLKYPDELDEDLVVLIERLIEERGTSSG
ncbi:MAG TPA: hypothetical protein G4O10_00010 [Dehalococcoidia bacterium]|nr:hypothetical protein [Dehalococcoidia bacterium]